MCLYLDILLLVAVDVERFVMSGILCSSCRVACGSGGSILNLGVLARLARLCHTVWCKIWYLGAQHAGEQV